MSSSPNVLLLDDDTNTLLVLHAMLDSTPARIIECEHEECAVRYCRELDARINLLVADVVLEGSNGPEVMRKVRPLQPRMRVLFISGFDMTELKARGLLHHEELAPGQVEFLQKPLSRAQFLTTVEKLLKN